MPRSNKKKKPLKPPPKHPTTQPFLPPHKTILDLMADERKKMISRAIRSATYHGINLIAGTPNPGTGDCAFESVINNINDRTCFSEKLPLSSNYYRRMWVTDMANRTVDTDWNIYSRQDWLSGWQEMLVPGTYERGIFGDLMLLGIACGIRKILLIFNTNPDSPHDPIYVVDPRQFNIQADTNIPIILAYNQSHYESLQPHTEGDIQATVDLVADYLNNRYRFSKKDFPILLGLDNESQQKEHRQDNDNQQFERKTVAAKEESLISPKEKPKLFESTFRKETEERSNVNSNMKENNRDMDIDTEIDLDEIDAFLDSGDRIRHHNSQEKESKKHAFDSGNTAHKTKKIRTKASNNMSHGEETVNLTEANLCYKLKNEEIEYSFTKVNGKLKCPFCEKHVKNILLHFNKNSGCEGNIDKIHLTTLFEKLRKQNQKEKERIMKQSQRKRMSEESYNALLERNKQYIKNFRERKKNESQAAYLALLERSNQDKRNFRDRKRNESQESYLALLEQNKQDVQKSRARTKEETDEVIRRRNFNQSVIFGPIFTCSCCARMLYEDGVTKITPKFKENLYNKNPQFYLSCIEEEILVNVTFNGSTAKTGCYICHTCKTAMNRGKIPSMAVTNGLKLIDIEEGCHLTELENNLIAQNINFQYIYCLPKSRWGATKKQMISVPVTSDTVLNTIKQLPRMPREAGLIPVELKRKMIYEGCHKKEFIDPNKLYRVLDHLKKSGHPYYQFYQKITDYMQRCNDEDRSGYELLFGDPNGNSSNQKESDGSRIASDNEDTDMESDHDDIEEEKEMIYITKDPIRKHQFDHNRNTCMTNNYPEMFLDENGRQVENHKLAFAPAEGNSPTNLLNETHWDIKSWPALHPDGRYGLHQKRKVRLTDQQYFAQRILNRDLRFSKSPGYIFAAAAYIEQKHLSSKANISFMRGRKTCTNGVNEYELDDAFTVFEGIKNTPKYWQKVKHDMIAKLENIGPFHIFFTLSCGDTRCKENFSFFLVTNGYAIEYSVDDNGMMETRVKNGDGTSKTLEEFLAEDIDESLHEMIRTNVISATRNFHHRVVKFRNKILLGRNNPMNIRHISYRVEFQGRGAAHIHGTLWLDLNKIERNRKEFKGKGHLSEAFHKLRDDLKLTEFEKDAVALLTDAFITCSLNPAIVTQEVVDIALSVNCHYCTRKCENKCKYGFPRFPLKDTLVVDKHEFDDTLEEECNSDETRKNYTKILFDVQEILKNEERMETVKTKYPNKGKTKEENYQFRAERIDEMLRIAGDLSYDDYILAIKKSKKHGSAVLLQRDVDEIYVNNYNPEWLIAWNANLDIQPVLDFFAVITYVTDYWAKPDEGLTTILKEAAKHLKSEPELKKRCQQMANTFMTHRQMGEAEAYYKILPNLTLKYSTVDTIFVPSDKKALRSKFLMKLDDDDCNHSKGGQVKGGKEGIFLEKPDIIDKYCRRDMDGKEELAELRPSQFAKMYEPISRKKPAMDKDDENVDMKLDDPISKNRDGEDRELDPNPESDDESLNSESDDEENDDYKVANFIICPDPNKQSIRLPEIIKIRNPMPGEVAVWRKRAFPKAMRVHKKKEDNDPHRYFLSELMLYTAYTDEQELGCDDEKKCRDLYLENRENIQFVKRHLLPFAQGVEEARYYVEETLRNDTEGQNIGNLLDPQLEQDLLECQDEEELIHPDFLEDDPDDIEIDKNVVQIKKTLRTVEIRTADQILHEARQLDKYQKKVLNIAIQFAQDLLISKKGKMLSPIGPLLMVHGGAGSGKSTVIRVSIYSPNPQKRRR